MTLLLPHQVPALKTLQRIRTQCPCSVPVISNTASMGCSKRLQGIARPCCISEGCQCAHSSTGLACDIVVYKVLIDATGTFVVTVTAG